MPPTLTATARNGVKLTATATMLVSADLSWPMATTLHDVGVTTRGRASTAATGTLTYLADTLTQARALRDLYDSAATPVTLADDDAQLAALRHTIAGDITVRRSEPLNGVPAPWLVTVPILES